MNNGFFIVLEGPDGSGKSTQAKTLYHRLTSEGYSCIITEEPGGTPEGTHLKNILLNPGLDICPKTELFLFLADRAQHVQKVIAPSLARGDIVISSRYFYSTLAYQGVARQITHFDFLVQLNLFAVTNIIPDLVFYLDITPELGLQKAAQITSNSGGPFKEDRIEKESIAFHNKVREGYLKLASMYKDIFIVVDYDENLDKTGKMIYNHTRKRLFNDRVRKNR